MSSPGLAEPGPILAGLASHALTVGGFGAAFTAFVVAAVVLVSLMFAAAFTVSRAEERTVERIKARALTVKRWGGWILIALGVWFLVLAIFADFIGHPLPSL